MPRAKWSNPDGLDVYFGPRSTENGVAHQLANPSNGKKMLEIFIRGEDIPASVADAGALAADARAAHIPAGAVIISATLLVDELFAGASSTLDAGSTSLAGVVGDMNGFVAAQALAGLTAGARIAGAGALINTKLASAIKVVFGWGTAAFTAGSARLLIEYFDPPVQVA